MSDPVPTPGANWLTTLLQGGTAVPKAVGKLIDTVSDQIGLFLEPSHIRRIGQAEADVTVTQAKAKAEIATVKLKNKLALKEIEDRTTERFWRMEVRRQRNREAIVAQAAKGIPETVSDTPVDPDWVTQFFNYCQDVSDEQMQSLWARILAGEVTTPGSFSLRSLAAVKLMSKADADFFTRFCTVVWAIAGDRTPIIPNLDTIANLKEIQLRFSEFTRLDAIGLIQFQ
jgi:uncharacterized repeat protein (TIGR03899 family)